MSGTLPLKTRQLLNDLLESNIPDESAFAALLSDPPDEDQWLDYKAGAIMADPKRAARVVREYISGFANVEGGTLLIGYDQAKRRVDGTKAPGSSRQQHAAGMGHARPGPAPGFARPTHRGCERFGT